MTTIRQQSSYTRTVPMRAPARPESAVRFGFMSSASLAQVFQPVTEQFVYGFFAQDVVALWIPRIINALRRGRYEYDPREDPKIREKKPLQQLLHSIYRNAKGLNYPNAAEETLREVETGPGLLVAQSILLGAATTTMIGKLGLMMSRDELRHFTHALTNTMANPQTAQRLNAFKQLASKANHEMLLRTMMGDLLNGGHFKSHQASSIKLADIERLIDWNYLNKPRGFWARLMPMAQDPNKALVDMLKKAGVVKNGEVSIKDAVSTWINHWVSIDRSRLGRIAYNTQLDAAEGAFDRLVHVFNDTVRKVPSPSALNEIHLPGLGIAKPVKTSEFLENLRKFRPFIGDIYAKALKQSPARHMASWASTMQKALQESAQKVLRSTIRWKAGLSLMASLLAGITVITVSAIAQGNSKYVANRTVELPSSGKSAQPKFAGAVKAANVSVAQMVRHNFTSHQFTPSERLRQAASFFFGEKGGVRS